MANNIQKQEKSDNQPTNLQKINAYVTSSSKMLQKQLGDRAGEFTSNLLAIAESNADLQLCDPQSLMNCAMNATALNLPLNKNLGYAYVIPFKNKKKGIVEPQFQIGYKGFVQLAMRTGQYETINVVDVREGEMKFNKFTNEIQFLDEYPENEIVGYIAFFKLKNGFKQSLYMSNNELFAHADKYSQSFNLASYNKIQEGKMPANELWKYSSPWYKETETMAKKTVLKLLLTRWGLLSVEMQQAIERDQTDDKGNYIDNEREIKNQDFTEAEIVPPNQIEPKQEVTTEKIAGEEDDYGY